SPRDLIPTTVGAPVTISKPAGTGLQIALPDRHHIDNNWHHFPETRRSFREPGRLVTTASQLVGFCECRNSLKGFIHSVFHQRLHSQQAGLPPDVLSRLAAERQLANGGVNHHQLKNRLATAVTRMLA